ncbi:MAG: hypothetical protein ACK4R2_03430 [Roseateles sp.]
MSAKTWRRRTLLARNAPAGIASRRSVPYLPYLVSAKLDGVRARWNGATLQLRSGRPGAAPAGRLAAIVGSGSAGLG